jgi:hypothetical protein
MRVENPMATILPFIQPETAFDEFTTSAMGVAFDAACAELQDGKRSRLIREIVAERIIAAAKRGERDPERLSRFALEAIKGDRSTG